MHSFTQPHRRNVPSQLSATPQQSPSSAALQRQALEQTPTFPASRKHSYQEQVLWQQLEKPEFSSREGQLIRVESFTSGNRSDIVSINLPPGTMPSAPLTNYLANSLNKILFSRIARYINELRTLQASLMGFLQEHQMVAKQYREQLFRRFQEFLVRFAEKRNEKSEDREMIASKTNMLQAEIRQKNQQISQLNSTIQSLNQLNQANKQQNVQSPSPSCMNCKLLEIKLKSVHDEALQMGKQNLKLSQDNECLQEKVFDLEQRVVGIQLQVEKRLKQVLAGLSPSLSNSQLDIMDSLAKENQKLVVRCQQYEAMSMQQHELQLREEKLQGLEQEYQLKNNALLESLARNQHNLNLNYEREHQLLLAEENMMTKIEELRRKEMELSEWESDLSKQQHANQLKQQHNTHNSQMLTLGRQLAEDDSLRSFGTPQNYQTGGMVVQGRSEAIYVPSLPLFPKDPLHKSHLVDAKSKSKSKLDNSQKRVPSRPLITESAYHPKPNDRLKSQSSSKNLHKQSQVQHVQTVPLMDNMTYNGSRATRSRQHSVAKEKRLSPSRSIRPYVVTSQLPLPRTHHYSGIENKLDRLRDELRKQIDSIRRD